MGTNRPVTQETTSLCYYIQYVHVREHIEIPIRALKRLFAVIEPLLTYKGHITYK